MKLDNSKIETINNTTSTAYTSIENKLYDVNKSLTVLTNSINFKGKGAEAHKSFMAANSMNATYALLKICKDVQTYVNHIKSGFLEFESDSAGKVSSESVSAIQGELQKISKNVETKITSLEDNEKKAAEYISVESTNTSQLTNGFSTIDSNLEKINDDFLKKDTELAKKSEAILESISKLNQMLTQIKGNYVTPSGKYDEAKFLNLSNEPWYVKGDIAVFDDKKKKDPYSYNTMYVSLLETQLVTGWDKEGYGYMGLSLGQGNIIQETNNGTSRISASGDLVSGDLQLKTGPFLNMKASGDLLSADFDASIGNGLHFKADVAAAKANARMSTLDDHLFFEVNAKAFAANAEASAYMTDKKSELGFDVGATKGELSADFGFDMFKYSVKDKDGNDVGKSLFAANIEPVVTAGGSATAKVTVEEAYDDVLGNKDWDIGTVNVRVGASFLVGADIDVTIPYIWPDGWFK